MPAQPPVSDVRSPPLEVAAPAGPARGARSGRDAMPPDASERDLSPSAAPLLPGFGAAPLGTRQAGVLPAHMLRDCIRAGYIASELPVEQEQIQPASVDLRLGPRAFRIRASFLPGPQNCVEAKLNDLGLYEIDLSKPAVFERGCFYLVPLLERLALPARYSAIATPKSSTGRLDVFARLITDYGTEFERIGSGYRGGLYLEISPRTFSIIVRAGDRLNQLRVRRGMAASSDSALGRVHGQHPLVHINGEVAERPVIQEGLWVSVDLEGRHGSSIVAYRARRDAPLIDVSKVAYYRSEEYWEPIQRSMRRRLFLDPEEFYLIASRETITVPPDFTAEMAPYETTIGEFRAHYAGFFDPGFGCHGLSHRGTCAVLEVRSHEVPFLLEDGQSVGRLVYERLLERPEYLYGSGIGSHYARQGLSLSKHFQRG